MPVLIYFLIISGFIVAYFFVKKLAIIIPLYWFFSLKAFVVYLYNPKLGTPCGKSGDQII